jgi:hypothetical protein
MCQLAHASQDLQAKEGLKYNPVLERMARKWIEAVLERPLEGPFQEVLKSGVVLCEFLNRIVPNAVKSIYTGAMALKQVDNIVKYQIALREHFQIVDTFEPKDLLENKNLSVFVNSLHVLGKKVQKREGYTGPQLEKEDIKKTENLLMQELRSQDNLAFLDASVKHVRNPPTRMHLYTLTLCF